METDIRWKQRLSNFEKAFKQLESAVVQPSLNTLEEQGLIQCFEYNYELAWQLMKDYLTHQGIVGVAGSRDAIRQAFKVGLIADGEEWMNMVSDRILSVHTYKEEIVEQLVTRIRNTYFDLILAFKTHMK